MNSIKFILNQRNQSDALNYIVALSKKTDKKSKSLSEKINDYFTALAKYGLSLGEPYIKHIEGELWEIRPKNQRFLFAKINDGFYILSHFEKKTTKTPKREIDLAKARLKRFLEEQSNEDKP